MTRRTWLTAIAVSVLLTIAGATSSPAADFPKRPVTLVVPFAAGGLTDIIGRALGQKLGEIWGQSVIIDNKPGGGTIIGASAVAASSPDGYTLYFGSLPTFAIVAITTPQMPFDAKSAFAPISTIGKSTGQYVAVKGSLGVSNLKEFVDLARTRSSRSAMARQVLRRSSSSASRSSRHRPASNCCTFRIEAARRCTRHCWPARSTRR